MNRKIKLRVWSNKDKDFLHNITETWDLIYADGKWYFLGGKELDNNYVIQQWTGEYDMNRKPIYEGDIISSYSAEFINENFEAEIVFMDAAFHAKINEKDYRGVWSGNDIEVMGNIFQLPCNPDHNGECLVCDCWLSDCPFNKEKPQDDLQKLVKQDPMWQKPLNITDPKQ